MKGKYQVIEPVGFRVLIKPDDVEEKTESGIVLALDEKLERGATVTGEVVSVGPEAFRSFNKAAGFTQYVPWVKSGDRIYYARYAGKWVNDPDTPDVKYLMISDEDVIGKIHVTIDKLETNPS